MDDRKEIDQLSQRIDRSEAAAKEIVQALMEIPNEGDQIWIAVIAAVVMAKAIGTDLDHLQSAIEEYWKRCIVEKVPLQ